LARARAPKNPSKTNALTASVDAARRIA